MASERRAGNANRWSFGPIYSFLRRCIFRVISVGPLPNHIAFIMDGNRSYAKKKNLDKKDGYRAGVFNLMTIFKYCYELKIRYVSFYTFSIDNFRREREVVEFLMKLLEEKIEGLLEEESIIKEFGLRVVFLGNLNLPIAPEPDILVRTSGQTRLSNFFLWHTQSCILHSLSVFWPELGLWHLVWVLLNFQRHHKYLQKKRKQS